MTDKEKLDAIRAEIHRLVDVRGYDREMANDLFAFMDSLPNEPVSEELEEASQKQKDLIYPLPLEDDFDDPCFSVSSENKSKRIGFDKGFKSGAKWQKEKDDEEKLLTYKHGFEDCKEQMMAKAAETTFNVSLSSGLYDKLWIKGCKEGDKLLVIKKDEL